MKAPIILVINPLADRHLATITNVAPDAVIRYTTDGSEPTENSSVYKMPFVINKQTVVKARGFRDGRAIGVTKQAGW